MKSPSMRLEMALEQSPPGMSEAEQAAISMANEAILKYVDARMAGRGGDKFCLPDDIAMADVAIVITAKGLQFVHLTEVTKSVTRTARRGRKASPSIKR